MEFGRPVFIFTASPDGKPFRLYRIQLNNLGGSSGNCDATPVSTTPVPARTVNRRLLIDFKFQLNEKLNFQNDFRDDVSASPPSGSRGNPRMTRLNSRKDLRIRLEQQGGGATGSNPGSPGGSSSSSRGAGSGVCGSSGGYSRSCTASPTPGSTSPNAPSSPRSSSSGSPKNRPTNSGLGSRKLSLMAEELEGMRHVYLSPPPSPKLFFNINPQNTWEAFK